MPALDILPGKDPAPPAVHPATGIEAPEIAPVGVRKARLHHHRRKIDGIHVEHDGQLPRPVTREAEYVLFRLTSLVGDAHLLFPGRQTGEPKRARGVADGELAR